MNFQLSSAEALYISRRRKNETQVEAAARHSVSLYVYGDWERGGEHVCPKPPNVGALTEPEECTVRRRRLKLSLNDVAAQLSVSKQAVIDWESGQYDCSMYLGSLRAF